MDLDPEYVLDRMEFYEMECLMENFQNKKKDSWEQARMISYLIAQCNSSKPLKPNDILKFPWDKVEEVEKVDVDKMMQEMKQMEDKLNNNE